MSHPRPVPAAARLDALTALRWFAAFAVFVFHMRNMVTFPDWLMWLVDYGNYGVTFFFVLSGFVLTWSWEPRTPVRAFYWRRFARIYPLHIVALCLAIPVFYRPTAIEGMPWIEPLNVAVLFLSVLLIQGWSPDPAIKFSGNPAAWTLTVEALFYALHPAIVRGMARLRRGGALLVLLLVISSAVALRALSIAHPATLQPVWGGPVGYLPSFIVGMLVGWAMREGWRLRMPVSLATGLLLLALFCSHTFARTGVIDAKAAAFTPEIIVVLCAVLIATAATNDLEGRAHWLRWRPLVALGEWSFAFYLVHATLLYAALELFGKQFDSMRLTALWTAILLAVSVALSAALHIGLEKPVERRMRAWHNRRLASAAPVAVRPARSIQAAISNDAR